MKTRLIITQKDVDKFQKVVPNTPPPTRDDFYDRLMKYIPIEIVGGYVIIDGTLKSMLKDDKLEYALLGLLIIGLIGVLLSILKYFKIKRAIQVIMSLLAFAVWVFASGGWFKEHFDFWQAGWGTIAVVIFAIAVKYMRLPELPDPTLREIFKKP